MMQIIRKNATVDFSCFSFLECETNSVGHYLTDLIFKVYNF